MYGMSYLNTETVSTYAGSSFSSLQTDLGVITICGNLSDNFKDVFLSSVVPVELASFETRKKGEIIDLFLQTETEIDNEFFSL